MKTLVRIVNARYSVPAWLWTVMSALTALVYLFLLLTGSPQDDLISSKMPLGGWAWSVLTLAGAAATMYGMGRKKVRYIKFGSMISFFMWLFLAVAFAQVPQGVTNIIIWCVPMLIFWAYKYMASYLRPPHKGS